MFTNLPATVIVPRKFVKIIVINTLPVDKDLVFAVVVDSPDRLFVLRQKVKSRSTKWGKVKVDWLFICGAFRGRNQDVCTRCDRISVVINSTNNSARVA